MNRFRNLLVLACVLALGACGSGDDTASKPNDSKGNAGASAVDGDMPGSKPAANDPDGPANDQEPAGMTDPEPSTGMMMDDGEDPGTPDVPGTGQEDPKDPPVTTPPTALTEARAYMTDAGDGWNVLVEGKWELPANTEGYRCVRFTLPEDLWINEFLPVSPPGTHHTLLTVGAASVPDGQSVCTAGTNAPAGVTGSGVGTEPFKFPKGVGIHLRKGQQLVLNLHLFNTSDKAITGVSGTWMKAIPEAEVEHPAALMLAGTIQLDIPSGGESVQKGQCAMDQDVTLVAVAPHMHQLGVHLKAVAESSVVGNVMLHDGDYDFEQQVSYPLESIPMKKGDLVKVECTYDNTTDKAVHFGDSSLAEMCFAGLVRYPEGGKFTCVN